MEQLSKVHKVVSQLCSKCGHSCKSDKQYCPTTRQRIKSGTTHPDYRR